MNALFYVELDIRYCALTYGIAPCQASLTNSPPTGTIKCFNSPATCQDRENFLDQGILGSSPYNPTTLRFAVDTYYLPDDIECLPYIRNPDDIEITPAIVSLGQNLGQRATIRVRMRDARHSDTGTGGDKYLSERLYNPFEQGTFFGKLRARQPFLRGQNMRLIHGELGQALEEMETRHFVVESFSGPSADGVYELIGKDVLKFADGDRAQAPRLSNGFLLANITNSQFSLTLSPAGIGDEEYPETGYAAIGGKEVVQFWRDSSPVGNDVGDSPQLTRLLIHCDGLPFTDDALARAITNGGGGVDIGAAIFVEGSAEFDGASFLSLGDNADWTPTGDFTWDMWIRPAVLTGGRFIMQHQTDSNNQQSIQVSALGSIGYSVHSGGVLIINLASANGEIAIDTTYHIAVVRSGTGWFIFKNGISIATLTDADAIPNFTGTLFLGSPTGAGNLWNGRIDEIRLSHTARWTATFTPPVSPYLTSSDQLQIARAKFNTEAVAHNAEDRVQLCLVYEGQDVADIIYDLLVNYSAVPAQYISLPTWQEETATFLGTVYTALIGEPHAVEELCAELIEQAGLVVWWDDINRLIQLQVLRGITDVDSFTENNTNEGTLKITDQPDKRISQVDVYFGKLNPLLKQDEITNYRSTVSERDLEAEEDYGTPAIKKIYSRWIPDLGRSIADRLIEVLFSRYRDPPRRFEFEVMRNAMDAPQLGRGYRIESWALQDDTGAQVDAPIQLTRLNPTGAVNKVEAEEMLFAAASVDLANRQVIVDANILNVNLRTSHDAIYPDPDGTEIVTCTINLGVIVGSSSNAVPSFDVGVWPVGTVVIVRVRGRIQGCGGNGASAVLPFNGGAGGTAMLTARAITLELDEGSSEVWGGGGGGGAHSSGLGGGGGAGQIPGGGGSGVSGPTSGSPGTTEAGGAGAILISSAGDGGDPGLAGGSSTGPGGAAGNAIEGNSFVTFVLGADDIRGPQIG